LDEFYHDAAVDDESDCNWEVITGCNDGGGEEEEEERVFSVLSFTFFSTVVILWPCLAKSARRIALKSIVLGDVVEGLIDESDEEFFVFCWCSKSNRLRICTEGKLVCCCCCWGWGWLFIVDFIFEIDDLRRCILSVDVFKEIFVDSWRIKYEWSWYTIEAGEFGSIVIYIGTDVVEWRA